LAKKFTNSNIYHNDGRHPAAASRRPDPRFACAASRARAGSRASHLRSSAPVCAGSRASPAGGRAATHRRRRRR